MRPLILLTFLSFPLASCAHDNYSGGDPAQMQVTLNECKRQALHEHFEGQSSAGIIAGGLIGGAIGGALMGAAEGSGEPGINQLTERCMAERGYQGTSEN